MSQIFAPWEDYEVEALNAYQRGPMHPFTCGGLNHPAYDNVDFGTFERGRTLIAFLNGWRCPSCEYTQNWAHDFMIAYGRELVARGSSRGEE